MNRPTDSWFPYNDEPVFDPQKGQPKRKMGPTPPPNPYPENSPTGGTVPIQGSVGVRGTSVTDPTWTASAPGGELMDGMPPSSEFQGWEYGANPLTVVPDMVRSSLMAKMNGITRSYF